MILLHGAFPWLLRRFLEEGEGTSIRHGAFIRGRRSTQTLHLKEAFIWEWAFIRSFTVFPGMLYPHPHNTLRVEGFSKGGGGGVGGREHQQKAFRLLIPVNLQDEGCR